MSQSHSAWQQLQKQAEQAGKLNIRELLNEPSRVAGYSIEFGGIYLDYSKHLVTDAILANLLTLAEEAAVSKRAHQMYDGEHINVSEDRAVLHTALRKPSPALPAEFIEHIHHEREKLKQISHAIRRGDWRSSTGESITDVIHIGIGGSDLGPRMVCAALAEFADGPACHFIANVDGAEVLSLIRSLNAATTLVIIASKTFTTAETLRNAETVLAWFASELQLAQPQASQHCIGVTGDVNKAREFGIPESQILTFRDAIGGRYSLWSSIGLPICISTGFDCFVELLEGGAAMDEHFLNAPAGENMPVILGLLGIWYNNFLKAQTHAIIPYCQRLGLLVDYIQQVDMESNGKSATIDGQAVIGETGPIIWGQTGTNSQHAFFQLLHQGSKLIPVDFIGLAEDNLSNEAHHTLLLTNMIAQAEALMVGRESPDPNRSHPGNRPNSTLLLDALTPRNLGMLLALYEHKVFVQGCIWRINSFDQWGVELGKALARDMMSGRGDHDPSTLALKARAGLTRQAD